MKKTINNCHIEGILYQHTLEQKVTGPSSKNPGTEYISGYIDIATNDALTNIIQVHFSYATAKTSTGKTNQTFTTLQNIISGAIGCYINDGDAAARVRVDSAIGLNEFYSDRTGESELVSVKRNEGGFIHTCDKLVDDENQRNTFECDMLITRVTHMDADEERNIPERVIVKGCTFDFKKAILPIELTAVNPNAMAYFEGLEASDTNPTFTKVWGRQVSTTTTREIRTESAFGDDSVRTVENTRKDWIITGASKEPYMWDDENSITAAELTKAIADRNTYLATMKQRSDEWKASQNQAPTAAPGGFNF